MTIDRQLLGRRVVWVEPDDPAADPIPGTVTYVYVALDRGGALAADASDRVGTDPRRLLLAPESAPAITTVEGFLDAAADHEVDSARHDAAEEYARALRSYFDRFRDGRLSDGATLEQRVDALRTEAHAADVAAAEAHGWLTGAETVLSERTTARQP